MPSNATDSPIQSQKNPKVKIFTAITGRQLNMSCPTPGKRAAGRSAICALYLTLLSVDNKSEN